jgi:molybdopterin-binding protein
MEISARNVLRGIVRNIEIGVVNAEVTLEIAPGVTIVSVITAESVSKLKLARGGPAYAVIKSSSVMMAVD